MVKDKFWTSAHSEFRATVAAVPIYRFSSWKAVSQRAET